MNFYRGMSANDIRDAIQKSFKSILKQNSFTVLENKGGSKLVRASYKELKGSEAVDRRGALYLTEKYEVNMALYLLHGNVMYVGAYNENVCIVFTAPFALLCNEVISRKVWCVCVYVCVFMCVYGRTCVSIMLYQA